MDYRGANLKGGIFISCIKEVHYSREVVLDQHALVHILAGGLRISYADQLREFGVGDTLLIPRNQLGKLSKYPIGNEPFRSVSVLFAEEELRKFYASHPVKPVNEKPVHGTVLRHPLLDGLFSSMLPYFEIQEELPAELATVKTLEVLTILSSIDPACSRILASFEEPGKLDLADFMELNFMYNLSLEKFGYLTGRSLTTFKKDFKKIFSMPPGKWLTQKRLERAHYLLKERRERPSDVYLDAGFENLSHFSYAFKKHFGYSPTSV